jgi:hypothetical protein
MLARLVVPAGGPPRLAGQAGEAVVGGRPSSTSVPPSGRELMKLRSDPAVARSAAAGFSSRDSDTISRSIAAVST